MSKPITSFYPEGVSTHSTAVLLMRSMLAIEILSPVDLMDLVIIFADLTTNQTTERDYLRGHILALEGFPAVLWLKLGISPDCERIELPWGVELVRQNLPADKDGTLFLNAWRVYCQVLDVVKGRPVLTRFDPAKEVASC